ncbi:hypothetical protein SUNI508_06332 [Seiridium unicorne]
MPLDI